MNILIFILIFFLGTIIGSFLNVVIYRFNTGKSIVKGRSMCMTCSHKLRWYELIPVFSFLIQSGRCRSCASSISHQYPIVEFITGIVFVLITMRLLPLLFFSPTLFLVLMILFVFVFSLLIVICFYDIRHKIVPNKLVYVFIVTSFLSMFINYNLGGTFLALPSVIQIVAGPLIALPFALIWFLSKGRLMGLGDGKIILGIGWLFVPYQALAVIILSFWIGLIFSLVLMLLAKSKVTLKTEIPFAPFLVISSFIVFFFGLDIFYFSDIFNNIFNLVF